MSLKNFLEEAKKKDKIPLIVVLGPTAVGKSKLAIEICKKYGGEAVSAGSMQVYKGLAVATAKPSEEEMQGVKHHMLGFMDLNKNFNAYEYAKMVEKILEDINERGLLPVLVGGTGLYIDSLLKGIKFTQDDTDLGLRAKLDEEAEKKGTAHLYEKLSRVDPEFALRLSPNDKKRIIRALERYMTTGQTPGRLNIESQAGVGKYKPICIGLDFHDRQLLYNQINLRVDKMVEQGIFKEAANFFNMPSKSKTASQAIGVKEFFPYFEGRTSKEDCIENLKQATRRYAKRQLTWFRKNKDIKWFYLDDFNSEKQLYSKVYTYLNTIS